MWLLWSATLKNTAQNVFSSYSRLTLKMNHSNQISIFGLELFFQQAMELARMFFFQQAIQADNGLNKVNQGVKNTFCFS